VTVRVDLDAVETNDSLAEGAVTVLKVTGQVLLIVAEVALEVAVDEAKEEAKEAVNKSKPHKKHRR
ncbi:MAG: hypothetical protein KC492_21850, partial [Myxococcales bacterium]|nr:hypothetical protein [Myxococcales bacterium]